MVTKEFGLTNHTTNGNARNQNRHRQENIVSKSIIVLYVKGPKQSSLLGDSFLPNGQETWVIIFSCILYFTMASKALFSSIDKRAGRVQESRFVWARARSGA